MASVWQRLGEIVGSISDRTGVVGSLANAFDPDNWLPGGKDAAFTLALIALSAKMAVSDGVVTASELRAFHRTVEIVVLAAVDADDDGRFDRQAVAPAVHVDGTSREIRRRLARSGLLAGLPQCERGVHDAARLPRGTRAAISSSAASDAPSISSDSADAGR